MKTSNKKITLSFKLKEFIILNLLLELCKKLLLKVNEKEETTTLSLGSFEFNSRQLFRDIGVLQEKVKKHDAAECIRQPIG